MSSDVLKVDTVIIGAGVVGLAIAKVLAEENTRDIFVLEQHGRCGEEVSSHNSGVIHAGLYYPQDSLKAKLCVQGNQLLYEYAEKTSIPHKRIGKLIVAKEGQRESLQNLFVQAKDSGVQDVSWLERDALFKLEPEVKADIAILSPSTGIIDAPSLMQQLEFDASAQGASMLFQHEVTGCKAEGDAYELTVNDDFKLRCRRLINAAGLSAGRFCHKHKSYFAQGQYYSYQAASPFSHLVYPLPEANQQGLGVHSSLDMQGQLQFGPDVKYQDAINYAFDESRKPAFIRAIQQYFPSLNADKLKPGQVGVRPKISGPGEPSQDFHFSKEQSGQAVMINLMGIESPGLTASLAIGLYVRALLNE